MQNNYIQQKLDLIQHCIETNVFIPLEDTYFEVKDLSTGSHWQSLNQKEVVPADISPIAYRLIYGK